jgi:hypothetical protein
VCVLVSSAKTSVSPKLALIYWLLGTTAAQSVHPTFLIQPAMLDLDGASSAGAPNISLPAPISVPARIFLIKSQQTEMTYIIGLCARVLSHTREEVPFSPVTDACIVLVENSRYIPWPHRPSQWLPLTARLEYRASHVSVEPWTLKSRLSCTLATHAQGSSSGCFTFGHHQKRTFTSSHR